MKSFLSGLGLMCLGVSWVPVSSADAALTTPTLQGSVTVQSWKDRRDAQIVKQDLDYFMRRGLVGDHPQWFLW